MFYKLFQRRLKIRLKPMVEDEVRGLRAFFMQPVMGRLCWLLMWLSVLTLVIINKNHDKAVTVGRPSPFTMVSVAEFGFSDNGGEEILIPAGSVLVERGRVVAPEAAAITRAYRNQVFISGRISTRVVRMAGDGMILLIGLLLCAAMLRLLKPDIAGQNSMLLLFFVISLLTILPSNWYYLLNRFPLPIPFESLDAIMPLALAPLLALVLMGPLPAIVMGVWASFAVAVLSGYSLAVFVTGLASAVVIARITRFVRTRSAILRIGFLAGLAGAICVLGFSAVAQDSWDIIAFRCLLIVCSGVLSALIALLVIPFLEILFGISTDISLLELSDFEHPLLKRLAIEAPGTYHHSLMVANLAQAATNAIGGNALRVGICSYFHDIGKLVKPSYFSENTQIADSPHDDLSPSMSTLVIISHVKEGVNLALRHKLPKPVVNAIQQHHGNGLVYFFYHKARENIQLELSLHGKGGASEVKESDFRYPGPRPKSRETAVLCLADSIEASSRSLEKITPGNIEHLVNDIVSDKLRDGQLDDCGLTLAEVGKIRKAFVFTLSNMLHSRVSYPGNEYRNKQHANTGSSGRGADTEAGSASDGARRTV